MVATWLETNKIFFEVFSSIVFGIASIFVAMASYRVYKQQLLTSQLQFKPHFSVQQRHLLDEESDHVKQIDLLMFNHGSPASNIRIERESYLKLFWYSNTAKKELILPMHHYFFGKVYTGSPEGLIATISGNNNRGKYMALKSRLTSAVGFDVFFSAITTIKVTCENRLGEKTKEYFIDDVKVDKEVVDKYDSLLVDCQKTFSIDADNVVDMLVGEVHKHNEKG